MSENLYCEILNKCSRFSFSCKFDLFVEPLYSLCCRVNINSLFAFTADKSIYLSEQTFTWLQTLLYLCWGKVNKERQLNNVNTTIIKIAPYCTDADQFNLPLYKNSPPPLQPFLFNLMPDVVAQLVTILPCADSTPFQKQSLCQSPN